jgi:hypothetical protein
MVRTSFPEIGAEHMLQSLTAGCGTSLQFAAAKQFSRLRSEADTQRAALTEPDL